MKFQPASGSFSDAQAYENFMGAWSQEAGRAFLHWLNLPASTAPLLEIGCGGGAFTELLCAAQPGAPLTALDVAPAQLALARERCSGVDFLEADAHRLPLAAGTFQAVFLPLVLVFFNDSEQVLREALRVSRPGATIAAYIWDLPTGFPYFTISEALRALDLLPGPKMPAANPSNLDALEALWAATGLVDCRSVAFRVEQTYPRLESYWAQAEQGEYLGQRLRSLSPTERQAVWQQLERALAPSSTGLRVPARVHCISGRVPER